MSLGKDFEDKNNCKPYINKTDVFIIIEKLLSGLGEAQEDIQCLLTGLNSNLTQKYFDGIISNYQKEIRIGYFTVLPDNSELWVKYFNNESGYCLEYQHLNHNYLCTPLYLF